MTHPTTTTTNTHKQLVNARKAVRDVAALSDEQINTVLNLVADALVSEAETIIEANRLDLAKFEETDYRYDRLKLTRDRIDGIAADMRNVARLKNPRHLIESRTLPNGLIIERTAVPFGVVGVIYEARPNVSADVFSLCFKSGNVCVLKGGSDAENSNKAIVRIIKDVLCANKINPDAVTLLDSNRQATTELLHARGLVDVLIPRGSKNLIDTVRQEARIPVIETGAGVCHCYVHTDADMAMATKIVNNAKTRRVSVCNALDCLIVDRKALGSLVEICAPLAMHNVVIHADAPSLEVLRGRYPENLLREASPETYGTEFLGYEMAVKTVDTVDEALDHIDRNGSGHSESIVTENKTVARLFHNTVDAACVYVNAPTSFTDGAQFGLGAEIGISTQKLHARGPMALDELTTYKWLITGQGQTRP